MHEEKYNNYSIVIIWHKTDPGWSVKWEIVKPIKNGRESIKAELLSIEEEISEDDAVRLGVREAQKYINRNL